MVWRYIRTPFGSSGDRAAIPNDAQPDGSVSQVEGFGINYQLDPATDPDALNVPRDKFNEIEYGNQVAIQQLQQESDPQFITTSDNGGTPYSYKAGVRVRFTGGWAGAGELVYYSLVNANNTSPTDATKWGLVQYAAPYFTGFMMPWLFSTLPVGSWIWLNGRTVGSVASNATGRANADTEALFLRLWADFPVTLQLFDSSGAPVSRGISAAADWAANRAIALPDMRGRSFFGADNMGGASAAGRITVGGSGISGTAIGAAGGLETVQLTGNQNGTHSHTGSTSSNGDHFHEIINTPDLGNDLGYWLYGERGVTAPIQPNNITQNAGAHTHSFTTGNSGLGEAHQNMPPAYVGGGWIVHL